jgi:hypothetical protein
MMNKEMLLTRLSKAHPGWDVFADLIAFVKSRDFEYLKKKYVGNFIASGERICFTEHPRDLRWPDWIPAYVPALYGMKADYCEMAGGYAGSFTDRLVVKGSVFTQAGTDLELSFPSIEVPTDTYYFQSNSSGAEFFLNKRLEVLYPDAENKRFNVLALLEQFTQKNIEQVLAGKLWFSAYSGSIKTVLMD